MTRALLVFVTILILTPHAFAWGSIGHRVTGEIATNYLSDKATQKIRELLGNESLAEATTWADYMRSSPDPFWRYHASPWHYVTVPEDQTYQSADKPDEGDAVTALTQFTNTLKDRNASMSDKKLALRFAIHIIGDLHQPFHAGNGKDRGGNDVRVKWFSKSTNMHALWDTGLIDHEKLSYTEWTAWLVARISREQVRSWSTTDPHVWIAESVAIRDTIYPNISKNLSWGYAYKHRDTIRQRLSQAGVRIAAYLNEVFTD